jgi:hypothetical protein
MAGRPRKVRSIQSYINHSDAHSGLSMLKAGTAPQVGVTRNFWWNYQTQSSQGPLDFVNSQEYYKTLQWQRYGNLRPSFVPSPRQGYTNYRIGSYPSGSKPLQFNGNYNSN